MISSHYQVRLVPQSYDMGCWSAAVAMMFDTPMSVGPGSARLDPDGGLPFRPENVERLARSWGLNVVSFTSFDEDGFAQEMASRGPLMICGGMDLQGDGSQVYPHAVVAYAYDGRVHIHDPLPVGTGSTHHMSWHTFMRRFPLGALFVLSRR